MSNVLANTEAAAALQESEERFVLASQGTDERIWDWDARTNTLLNSPRYLELLGYEDEKDLDTLSVFENIIHPDDRPHVMAAI